MKNLLLSLTIIAATSSMVWSQASVNKTSSIEGGNFTSVVEFRDTLYTTSIDNGTYISTDDGISWQKDSRFNIGWTPLEFFRQKKMNIVVADEFRDQLYIAGTSGLIIHSSGSPVLPTSVPKFFGTAGAFGDIIVTDSALYASYRYTSSSAGEIVISVDDGITWTTHEDAKKFFSHLASTSDGRMIGATSEDLFISDSEIKNFEEIDIPNQRFSILTDIYVNSNDEIFVSTLSDGVLKSSDSGENWTTAFDQSGALSITKLNSGKLLVGGIDGNLYSSADDGATWNSINLGFDSSIFNYLGINNILELSDGTLLGATLAGDVINGVYDNASPGMLSSSDDGNTWTASAKGLEAQTLVQLFFDSETQEKYVFVKGLGVFKSASDSEEWVSVGNEGTPDLTNIDGISDSKPGWSSAGSNFTLSKNPVTNELWMVSKQFTLYLDAETNDWKFYEHDPYDFFQPSSLGFFADETAYVHESLGPFQGIYSSTDGVAWTRLENSPSNANLTQFEAFDGYMTYFDNYAFDDSVGTHISTDGGVTSTFLQADREGFFIATDYFSDRQNKEVITALYTATDIIIETYDLKTKETTEEVFTTEQTITSATPNTITQLPNKSQVLLVNGFDSETNATGPIAYFYKEVNANSWTKIDSEIMPKGAADEITIIGNNKLMFRFGPELYTATIGDVIPISNEQTEDRIPKSFTLHANYPNPFNPTTQLNFELSTPAKTTVSVYSIIGQKVQTLELGTLSAGAHQATFDATNLPSGVYLYTVKSGNSLRSGKMTLIK